jgi:hypothetical protein
LGKKIKKKIFNFWAKSNHGFIIITLVPGISGPDMRSFLSRGQAPASCTAKKRSLSKTFVVEEKIKIKVEI